MGNQIRLALFATLVMLVPVSLGAAQNPSGTYAVTLSTDDVKIQAGAQISPESIVGTWSITFGADRTYSVKHDDVEHVTGKYTMNGDEIRFNDASGDYACMGGNAPEGCIA